MVSCYLSEPAHTGPAPTRPVARGEAIIPAVWPNARCNMEAPVSSRPAPMVLPVHIPFCPFACMLRDKLTTRTGAPQVMLAGAGDPAPGWERH